MSEQLRLYLKNELSKDTLNALGKYISAFARGAWTFEFDEQGTAIVFTDSDDAILVRQQFPEAIRNLPDHVGS